MVMARSVTFAMASSASSITVIAAESASMLTSSPPLRTSDVPTYTNSTGFVESSRTASAAVLEKNLPYPPGLSASADGRTILWTRLDAIGSDLLLAEWSAIESLVTR